ncbi:MAG: hypothetical protein ACREE4_01480 [Stellaceae bacterium]
MSPLAVLLHQIVLAAGPLTPLLLMAAGFALIVGLRRWAGRFGALALLAAIIHVYGDLWIPH